LRNFCCAIINFRLCLGLPGGHKNESLLFPLILSSKTPFRLVKQVGFVIHKFNKDVFLLLMLSFCCGGLTAGVIFHNTTSRLTAKGQGSKSTLACWIRSVKRTDYAE